MESMRTNEMPPKMDGPLPKMKTKRVKAKPAASSSDEGPKLEVGELVFALWSDSHWPAVVKQDRGAKVSIVFLPYKQRDQPFNKKKADLVFVESADQLVCPADCTNPEYKLAFAIGAHLYQLGPQKSAKILTTPLTPKQHTMAMQGKNITYEFLGDFKPEGDKEAAEEEEESVGLPQELIKTFKENKKSDLFKPRPKRKVGQSEESPAKKVSRTIPLNEKLFSKDLKKLSEEEMTCLEKNQVFLAEVLNPLNTGLWPVLVEDIDKMTVRPFGTEIAPKVAQLFHFPTEVLSFCFPTDDSQEPLSAALNEVRLHLQRVGLYDPQNVLELEQVNMDALSLKEPDLNVAKRSERQKEREKEARIRKRLEYEMQRQNPQNAAANVEDYPAELHIDESELIQHCTDPILPNLRMTTADMIGTVINTHFESIWAGQAPIPHLKRHQLFLHHVFFTKRCHIFPRTEGCSADLYGLVDSELLERMYDEYMGMVRLANKIPRLTELERSKYIMQVMFPEAIEFAVAKKFGMDTETVEKFLAACDRVVSAREMRIDDPLALAEINSLLTKNCPTFFTDTHEQENRAESTENSPPIFLKSDVEAQ
ncbi:unnamed protein product [Bursaphelenchus xylophilus]|nr:unnamed protein product [Bursaphelenchus xylophilus]CAG9089185.1 unnamed protein product [Bursaphelenchus xylophilus]